MVPHPRAPTASGASAPVRSAIEPGRPLTDDEVAVHEVWRSCSPKSGSKRRRTTSTPASHLAL
ncbi:MULTISPECIES: hypothetical protein [Rhodococcus]|uniref:hypothetical protein n=1 Tax=Rhodococcus TaxID=1827 RepID=UPI0002FF3D6E|nr:MULTISPECIES: hypothetical protein [Rhodococcus]UOT08207.1 hypothetical protein MPY17_38365 [Rhodococcus opacus]